MTTQQQPRTTHSTSHSTGQHAPETDSRMDAVVQDEYGSNEVLRMERVDRPAPQADEVLIEVHTAGLDQGVWHLVTGTPYAIRLMGFGFRRPKSRVPGMDVAGRVVAVGGDVTRFSVGDEVFGIGRGTFAEFAVAKETKLSLQPAGLSLGQTGAAAISGITALQALTSVGKLEPGQSVLVIGASGGVGSYAAQIARALGATVTGVCSPAKVDFVRSMGVSEVVDYTREDYLDGSRRYDLVIDTGGRNSIRRLRKALTPGGTLVIVGGEGGDRFLGGMGRQLWAAAISPFLRQRLAFFLSGERTEDLERLAALMADGSVVPAIGQHYPLGEAPQAIADLEAGRIRGKAVIDVRDPGDH